jgi:hypothetical protein
LRREIREQPLGQRIADNRDPIARLYAEGAKPKADAGNTLQQFIPGNVLIDAEMLGPQRNPTAVASDDIQQQTGNGQAVLGRQRQPRPDKPARRAGPGRPVGRYLILTHGTVRLNPQNDTFERTHPYFLTDCGHFSSCILSNDH